MKGNHSGISGVRVASAAMVMVTLVTGARIFEPLSAELASFSIGSYAVTAGSTAPGVATVSSLERGLTPIVRFTSSNTAVATVPAMKAASSTGVASVSVTGVSAGCATISASFNGKTRSDGIVVHAASSGASFTMTVPDGLLAFPVNNKASLNMRLQATGSSLPGSDRTLTFKPAVWSLSSSNPGVASVPSTVTQVSSSTPFSILGVSDGCAIITAKLGTQSVSKTVRVVYIGG